MKSFLDPQNLFILASTLRVIGDVLIVMTLFSVHSHIMRERKIDADVLAFMGRERHYIIVGLVAILVGYIIELYAHSYGYL